MNPNEVTLETLARSWLEAKREEDAARERRQAIAKAIADALQSDEQEMTERRVFGNLKLVVTRKLNRAVDAKLAEDWAQLPDEVHSAFRWKPEVNLKNLRALEFAAPEKYAIAAHYITAKPATPAVEVEEIG